MKHLRQFSVALGISFLLLLPQFKHVFSSYNHFLDPWHIGFAGAILCAVLAWTVLFWVAYSVATFLTRFLPKKWKILFPVSIAAVLSYVLLRPLIALFYDKLLPPVLQVCVDTPSLRWVYYLPTISLAAFCAFRRPETTMRFFRRMGHIFAVLFVLNAVIALTWPRFPYPSDPVLSGKWRSDVPSENRKLIFIVMDEWSYHRTFVRDDLPERFPNLNRWLGTSTFYTNAYSPGASTPFAMTRILFGGGGDVPGYDGEAIIHMLVGARPPNDPSLFSIPDHKQAIRMAIGGFLFYPILLENEQMDLCVRLDTPSSRRLFVPTFASLVTRPVLPLASKLGISPVVFNHRSWPQMEIQDFSMDALSSLPKGKNAQIWLHHFIPHDPPRDRFGHLITHPQDRPPEQFFDAHAQQVADYEESLELMDRFMGEWEAFWKVRGEWDDACIVLMSDHEWRGDPDHSLYSRFWNANADNAIRKADGKPDAISWQHVPLIIKYPGQTEPEVVADRVYTKDLHRLATAYWNSPESEQNLRNWAFTGAQ